MDQNQQELMFKLRMFEQQIKSNQEQLQAIEQAVVDASSLNFGLDDIKTGEGKEVLASIGKGIFIKATLTSENLLVDVGSNKFVKKTVEETQKLIEEQIEKMQQAKAELEGNLEKINEEMTQVFMASQKEPSK